METEALNACKIYIVQKLQPNDGPQLIAFAVEMLSRIENEHDILSRIIFSDEATFHVNNKVNISTTAEFGAQKIPIQYRKRKETVPKINVWCGLSQDTVIVPFFFAETSVTANICLDMLQTYETPQIQHLQHTIIFQQDGALSHRGYGCSSIFGYNFP
ncbi:hypothetical protein AVEN_179718-1 [Araneus ventricosus]|uniref:Tc1-like transposase DDE domain-containing protein n=1 Tax=Araneus ventricosus TaxID=182803 RepID=A0A4Y2T3Y6_ARAVE|nr:hypothetical protein AVEN_179718-1 [Araneus ventricosus]